MYTEMSPETADFIKMMFDRELFDVVAKPGKATGGYCCDIPGYGCPFIFSNFNGTAGDVDVLTHEAGHAFAAYMAEKNIDLIATHLPSMEAAETHSMSMEFFAIASGIGLFSNTRRRSMKCPILRRNTEFYPIWLSGRSFPAGCI